MNKRIRELIEEATSSSYQHDPKTMMTERIQEFDKEKFAELIVQECVDRVTSKANGWGDMTGFAIKESILDCAKDLKEHFGVEE